MTLDAVRYQASGGSARSRVPRIVTAAGWPVLAGLIAVILGFGMLAAAALFNREAAALAGSGFLLPATRHRQQGSQVGSDQALFQIPDYRTHLDDVSLLFRIAKQKDVSIGPINYRSEASVAMPVVMRQLDFHVQAEYPKLKAFVAELLRRMPNLYLQEIQVDQLSGGSKVQATLKLSLVYEAPPDRTGLAGIRGLLQEDPVATSPRATAVR
jgi:hypothetical protein